jgi:hypothetical protein
MAKPTDRDTTDYSATKAPENKDHVESRTTSGDSRLTPGGAHGAPVEVGMSGLDRRTVPSEGKNDTSGDTVPRDSKENEHHG